MSLKKNEIIEQVEFCVNLTNRLKEAVVGKLTADVAPVQHGRWVEKEYSNED